MELVKLNEKSSSSRMAPFKRFYDPIAAEPKVQYENQAHIRNQRIELSIKLKKNPTKILTFFLGPRCEPKIANQVSKSWRPHSLFDALSESIRVFSVACKMAEPLKYRHTHRQ